MLSSAVCAVFHPHAALPAGVLVAVIDAAPLEPVCDSPCHPPHPVRGLRLRELDHLPRVRITVGRIVEVHPGVDDDPGMRGADQPGTLRLPHPGEPRHHQFRVDHPPLHRPVAHAQRHPDLRRHRPHCQIDTISTRVVGLTGRLDRDPRPEREKTITRGQQRPDRPIDLDEHLSDRSQRTHLLDRRVRQCRHTHITPPTTDIPTPDQPPKPTPDTAQRHPGMNESGPSMRTARQGRLGAPGDDAPDVRRCAAAP